MVPQQSDPNGQNEPSPTDAGNVRHVSVAVINAIFTGLASLYLAVGSIEIALIGAGLAVVLVWVATRGHRQ